VQMQPDPSNPDALLVATSTQALRIGIGGGDASVVAHVPDGDRIEVAEIGGGYLSYATSRKAESKSDADKDTEDIHEGVLYSLERQQVVVRLPCSEGTLLTRDEAIGIAYCPQMSDGQLPALVDLKAANRAVAVFPDAKTVAATGLRTRALLSHVGIGACRRAFIDIGGGIADDMYRGEGVLYDFARNRENRARQGRSQHRLRELRTRQGTAGVL
jgi:hypothetical protein